jgi:hypothetical protein
MICSHHCWMVTNMESGRIDEYVMPYADAFGIEPEEV